MNDEAINIIVFPLKLPAEVSDVRLQKLYSRHVQSSLRMLPFTHSNNLLRVWRISSSCLMCSPHSRKACHGPFRTLQERQDVPPHCRIMHQVLCVNALCLSESNGEVPQVATFIRNFEQVQANTHYKRRREGQDGHVFSKNPVKNQTKPLDENEGFLFMGSYSYAVNPVIVKPFAAECPEISGGLSNALFKVKVRGRTAPTRSNSDTSIFCASKETFKPTYC